MRFWSEATLKDYYVCTFVRCYRSLLGALVHLLWIVLLSVTEVCALSCEPGIFDRQFKQMDIKLKPIDLM